MTQVSETVRAVKRLLEGANRAIWCYWKKNDPDFLRALELLDEIDSDDLERVASTFARGGDTTLIILLLKAKRRAKYDDAYVRQERAFEKGLQPPDGGFVPVRAVLIADTPPSGVAKDEPTH